MIIPIILSQIVQRQLPNKWDCLSRINPTVLVPFGLKLCLLYHRIHASVHLQRLTWSGLQWQQWKPSSPVIPFSHSGPSPSWGSRGDPKLMGIWQPPSASSGSTLRYPFRPDVRRLTTSGNSKVVFCVCRWVRPLYLKRPWVWCRRCYMLLLRCRVSGWRQESDTAGSWFHYMRQTWRLHTWGIGIIGIISFSLLRYRRWNDATLEPLWPGKRL